MPKVVGLGHVGIFVRDLDRMTAFYRDFLGMLVTKRDPKMGVVFLSTDPQRSDHEIALVRRAEASGAPPQLHQVSMRVETLADLRALYRRLRAEGYRIDEVVSHASAIGCYYFDPEGNRAEVFWVTGHPCWAPALEPVDLEQPDEAILAQVERHWERLRHVPMGALPTPAPTA